jgi:AraC family transcriptional regulator of adaptative response/methylated-DNA-[protein]-cysteine methyltransferase
MFDAMSDDVETDRLGAVRTRDASADGRFFYAVLTTGVFCYPSCAARPARAENLRFFDDRAAAEAAGYRPCRRCRPDLPPRAERRAQAVAAACRAIEQGHFDIDRAAEACGLGRAAFARLFRETTGVTPSAYEAARRQRVAQASLSAGAAVTETIYQAGFSSSGRFYEAADAMLGMTPTTWRQGGAGETIAYAFGTSFLGTVLVAATTRGICAILLGDNAGTLVADLRRRFPRATLQAASAEFADRVAEVVRLIEAPQAGHTLPLDIRGTAFQRRVWQALRDIPAGRTASYGEVAASLGVPGAARAVGAACAANRLAVAVPCHRVVTGAGELSGYAWGPARKKALLAREHS